MSPHASSWSVIINNDLIMHIIWQPLLSEMKLQKDEVVVVKGRPPHVVSRESC